jgi:hypothetical protein
MRKQMLTVISLLMILGLTAAVYAQLLPPTNLTAQAGDGYVHLEWEEPGDEPPDLLMLRQHSNVAENAYYQQYDIGYGVVFDLATYPGATLEHIDFRHSPWGLNGTWQYKIHVVDWTNYTTIEMLGPFSTTVNNGWEMNVDLNSIAGNNGLVGVFIEAMSNSPTDAYPCIDGDNTLDGYSAIAPVTDFSDYTMSTIGDFLIDLWIAPASRGELVKAERIVPAGKIDTAHQARLDSSDMITKDYLMTQLSFTRELIGYNLYRDAVMINTDPILFTEYMDEDVVNDVTYSYYVTAVYTDGESDPSNTVEATPEEGTTPGLPAPFNLTGSLIGDDNVLLEWEAPEFGSWIHWDDGENYNAIGTDGAAVFKVAARFSPADLADFGVVGQYLTIVRFFPNEVNCNYSINIWTGGTATQPGDLVVDQPVPSPQIQAWNSVELDNAVHITGDEELWIGYHVDTQAGFPAGCDIGPALDGVGNMMYFNNAWTTLLGLAPTLNYNWNIHGFASFAPGREAIPFGQTLRSDYAALDQSRAFAEGELNLSPVSRRVAAPANSRQTLTGYRVYRNEVAIADVEETTYLDEELEPGLYHYYVTAVYDEEESNPSNTVTINTQVSTILFDDFEAHVDFALQFPPWTTIDLDQSETYGFTEVQFPNSGSAMAYIIFNPSATTPPLDLEAYSGDKMAASFAAVNGPNNDWMITPQTSLGDNSTLSFWARSYTTQYGMERMKVGVSTTSMLPTTFTIISDAPYIEVPAQWTQYTFDLSQWDNQNVWIAINCVSDDAFILLIDDFHVQGVTDVNVDDYTIEPVATRLKGNYPNPFNPETTISFELQQPGRVALEVFNIKGQKVATLVDGFVEAGSHNIVWNGKTDQNRDAGSGIYFYRMKSGNYTSTKKMILMK